ncbi:MAG: hypothetical protein AAB424_01050 [Patescibacteria group bacterium]
MKIALQKRAIILRRAGWSYNIIASRLHVSKSSLSHWLRSVPFFPNSTVRRRIREGPAKSAAQSVARKLARLTLVKREAVKELRTLNDRDWFMLGLGLYIGEGTKAYENITIVNADVGVIKLAIRWFTKIGNLNKQHFSVTLHIYPDISAVKAISYWSRNTSIPRTRFTKVVIDKRTNKSRIRHGRLPYGTAHVTVRSHGDVRRGVDLHRKIIAWIQQINRFLRV